MEFKKFLDELESHEIDLRSHYTAIKFFGYYHTEVASVNSSFSTSDINNYYTKADLTPPSNISVYIADLRTKKKIIRVLTEHYRLERYENIAIKNILEGMPGRIKISDKLKSLPQKLKSPSEQGFLKEAIDCFTVRANRATVIMMWSLCINHLYEYILLNKLTEFNSALSRQQGLKVVISSKDDFSELKETKFIEICRSAGIITNDVRKILDEKLGTRNSCAHPTSIAIKETKVMDFIEDLVENVIVRYEI